MESALAQALVNSEKHDGTRPDAHSRSRAKGGRDVKAVHGDVHALLDAGVHVNFMLNAA